MRMLLSTNSFKTSKCSNSIFIYLFINCLLIKFNNALNLDKMDHFRSRLVDNAKLLRSIRSDDQSKNSGNFFFFCYKNLYTNSYIVAYKI